MEEVLCLAYGEMGLLPHELEAYTPAEFQAKCRGFARGNERLEVIARTMTGFMMSVHLDKKAKFDIVTAWPILSVDEKNKFRTQTVQSKAKIAEMMNRLAEQKKSWQTVS